MKSKSNSYPFKNLNKNYNNLIDRRAFILLTSKSILFIILFFRLGHLQIAKRNEYKTLSDNNRIRIIPIIPKRGEIFDNKNNPLSKNKREFLVMLDEKINLDIIENLCKILSFSNEKKEQIIKKAKKKRPHFPIAILNNISWDQLVLIEKNIEQLSNIYIDIGYSRCYSEEYAVSHIIGYIGLISDKEKKNIHINYLDLYTGKTGLEKFYENTLRGNFGFRKIEANAYGKSIRELALQPSTIGKNIYLTLDLDLQSHIYNNILSDENSSCTIVTNINTGNILALVSKPTFNISYLSNQLTNSYWQKLTQDPLKPLIHKPIQCQYPPGSVFKIITTLAALRSGIKETMLLPCYGKISIGNNTFRCWHRNGHGVIDMIAALQHSCNCYMFQLSKIIGPKIIIETAKLLDLGSTTGIDLPNEAKGFIPSLSWKKKATKHSWTLGDTFNLSIGQGFTLTTLVQLSKLITAIAGNKLWDYSLLKKDKNTYKNIPIKEEYLDIVRQALYKVVNDPGGIAYSSRNFNKNFQFAGKTGTSQVIRKRKNTDYNLRSVKWKHRNHALFLGYAPILNPQYSVAILVEHGGGGGSTAAPIAKRIFSHLLS